MRLTISSAGLAKPAAVSASASMKARASFRLSGLAQLAAQEMAEGKRIHEQSALFGPLWDQAGRRPRQIADIKNQRAPQFARLPPAVVGGVVAEGEVDGQGHAYQPERRDVEDAKIQLKPACEGDDDRRIERKTKNLRQDTWPTEPRMMKNSCRNPGRGERSSKSLSRTGAGPQLLYCAMR